MVFILKKEPKKNPIEKKNLTSSNDVLAATVGGAIVGNLILPGLGGALIGGAIGAILINNSEKKS